MNSMTITVNGDERSFDGGTVTALLESLGLHPRMVVVEHNRRILRREELDDTPVAAGDSFELVHFVGGG